MTKTLQTYRQGEATLTIRAEWCKGCNLCVDACPKEILALDQMDRVYVTDIAKCIFCSICAERCPDFCISLQRPAGVTKPAGLKLPTVKEAV